MLTRRAARLARAAQPRRSADRARRPVHGRVRDLGRAELPGRLRRRGCRASCRTGSATTWTGSSGPTSRPSPSGTGRSASARPAAPSTTIVERRLGDPFFGIFLNPGHQIHLDEWVNSPIWPGSTIELRSGMAFQVDIIPATGTRLLHDEHRGRHRPRRRVPRERRSPRAYPAAWARIQARRRFMADALGIDLHPGRSAVLEHPRLPAAVPAPAGPGDDAVGLGVRGDRRP